MGHDPAFVVRRAIAAAGRHHGTDDRILLAVSGGADSLAMALAASRLGADGPRFGAVIVDHGLQAGSDAVAARAAAQCHALGLQPVVAAHVHVPTGPGSGGLEQAARLARRGALLDAAEVHDASAVWLAHTREDQAESVLLGLVRGSGPRSMAGMRARDGLWERPLLDVPRAVVRASLEGSGLEPHADPHNVDPAFTRVRVRQAVLPMLEQELGGHIVEQLVRSAALFRDDTDALDSMAEQWWDAHAELAVPGLRALPRALRTRVIRLALRDAGCLSPEKEHIDAVAHLVEEPRARGPVRVPGMLEVARDRGAGVLVIRGRSD